MKTVASLLRQREALLTSLREVDRALDAEGVSPADRLPKPRAMALKVLRVLAEGPKRAAKVAAGTGQSVANAAHMLWLMAENGEIRRVKRGVYALNLPRSA